MVTRATNKLSALQVKKIKPDPKKTIKLSDGGNLYLRIDPNGNKYWIFHYTRPITSKKNDLSLGSYPDIDPSQNSGQTIPLKII